MQLYKPCIFLFRVTAMTHLFSKCSHILYSGKNWLYLTLRDHFIKRTTEKKIQIIS